MFLKPGKFQEVTAPLPKRPRHAEDSDFGSDSAEDDLQPADSDLQSSDCAVNVYSDASKEDTSDDNDNLDYVKIPAAVTPAFLADLTKPRPSGAAGERPSGAAGESAPKDRGGVKTNGPAALYQNDYFRICYRMDYPALVCSAHIQWCGAAPKGLGRKLPLSRTISPHFLLEDFSSPTRTLICLRAWMLWRARKGGFATSTASRQFLFQEEAARLCKEFARFPPQHDGCLGNARANSMLRTWAPDGLSAAAR